MRISYCMYSVFQCHFLNQLLTHCRFCYLSHTYSPSLYLTHSVKLKVNKMTSTKTLLPIEYYRLPYCQPVDGAKMDNENLGEFLAGDRIESSPYLLRMKTEMYCEQLCISNIGRADQPSVTPNKFVKAIRKQYHNNWIVDILPSASKLEDDTTMQTRYWQGFPVGFISETDQKAYVYNHVNIEIEYHDVDGMKGDYRIVRFTVEPFSIAHEIDDTDKNFAVDEILNENHLTIKTKIKNPIPSCNPNMIEREHTDYRMITEVNPQSASGFILFTYDVTWKANRDLHWPSRWDIYLSMNHAIPAKVHLLSIAYSMVIVMVLSAVIVAIWIRLLHRDIANPYDYKLLLNDCDAATHEEDDDETIKECGWQAVRSDVFRPPSFSPMLLAVGCGSGAQLLCATIITVLIACIGFLRAPRRGDSFLRHGWLCPAPLMQIPLHTRIIQS